MAREEPGRSVSEMPVARVGPPGQPIDRLRASMTGSPSGISCVASELSSLMSAQMRVAACALRTSWVAAGASSATPSKEDRGTRTMTARSTCAKAPEVVCGMPMRSAPMTAAPMATTSSPRARADSCAERPIAPASSSSARSRDARAWGRVPDRDSSVAPSRTARVVAAMSVRAADPWVSARRTERAVSAGARTPETTRETARIRPAAGEMNETAPTVLTPTTSATRAGRSVLTTTLPTSSTSAPARVMRSPRRRLDREAAGWRHRRS